MCVCRYNGFLSVVSKVSNGIVTLELASPRTIPNFSGIFSTPLWKIHRVPLPRRRRRIYPLFFITLLPSFRPTFRKLIGPSPCPPPPLPSFSDGTERINIKPWSGPFQPPGLDKNERRRPLSAWIKTPIKTVDHRPRRPNWKAFSILLAVEKNRRARTKKRNRSRKSG